MVRYVYLHCDKHDCKRGTNHCFGRDLSQTEEMSIKKATASSPSFGCFFDK